MTPSTQRLREKNNIAQETIRTFRTSINRVNVPQYETVTCYYTVYAADQGPWYGHPQVSTSTAFQCELSPHKTATIYDGGNVNGNPLTV